MIRFLKRSLTIAGSASLNWIKVVIVQAAELGDFLIWRLSLIQKKLDLCLELSLLIEFADSTSRCRILLTVEPTTICAHGRNIVLEKRLILNQVAQGLNDMLIAAWTI